MDQTPPKTCEDYNAEGHTLWSQGKPKQALELFAQAVEALKGDTEIGVVVTVRRNYAMALRETGDFDASLKQYSSLVAFCEAHGFDHSAVLLSWAIALETAGKFAQARDVYQKIKPDETSTQLDHLKWEHAMGLLNWNEGRFTDAANHFAAASAALPQTSEDAGPYLAVLGNDAQLSLVLGHSGRAFRLVERMSEIRKAVPSVPLASEVNFVITKATLAAHRGDHKLAAKILKEGVDWIEENDPDEWIHKLDMVGRYAATLQLVEKTGEALSYFSDLCQSAPVETAWIGYWRLAQLQVDAADFQGARHSIANVFAFRASATKVETDTEIVAIVALLARGIGNIDAAVFLGKLSLKYLAQLSYSLDRDSLQNLIEQNDEWVRLTVKDLRRLGRFHEAYVIEDLFARVQRYALVLRKPGAQALDFQPVPFDPTETLAEAQWNARRKEFVSMRETANPSHVVECASAALDALLAFKSSSGLLGRKPTLPKPTVSGCLRLGLLPNSDTCELQILSRDNVRNVQIDLEPRAFFELVATLRAAVPSPVAWKEPAAELYRLLIKPIEADLSTLEAIEVDASAALGQIPIGLLTDGVNFVAQQVAVKYVVNVDAPERNLAQRKGVVHCAAFEIGPLARAPEALLTKTDIFEPSHLAIGPAFTRDRFVDLLQSYPAYISIATHFERVAANPGLSSLQLGDDTLLPASEFADEQYDLNGVDVALFATCSSGVDDATTPHNGSLAAVILEKGVGCFIGTLWDIPESAASEFIEDFWHAFGADPSQDPASVLKRLQADKAKRAMFGETEISQSGGIGSLPHHSAPENWAAFAVFENCNNSQHFG